MAGELGDRERRYVEAYLELESHSASARAGLRERIVAAALADEEEPEERAAARGLPRGAWVAAGLGLCAAAAALAWWVGRASLVEEHATRVHDQAPLVSEGERAVHEASARRGTAAGPARAAATTAEASAEGTLAVDPQPAASPAARVETAEAPAAVRRTEPEPARRKPLAEPEDPTPTLSDAEVARLERARRLARQGEHAAALAVLREHEESYPRSVLGPERTAEQVAVLCRMGAASAASARASFLAGDPPQYLRSRVEKACAP